MSQIQVDNIYNKEATGGPNFPLGANVTGVITATSFSGSGANLTGIDATALKDSNGTVRVQANTTGAVITGNVSVGGTLTYEDVTNVDAVGLITARSGINVSGGNIDVTSGDIKVGTATTIDNSGVNVTGVVTATSFAGSGANLTGIEAAPTIQAVANGTIAAESSVIVQSDGKVANVTAYAAALGTPNVYYTSDAHQFMSDFDSVSGKLIVGYADNASYNHMRAKVGTVSGTSITYSTHTTVSTGANNTQFNKGCSMACGNGKVVFIMCDGTGGTGISARAGTIDATANSGAGSITWGTAITLNSDASYQTSAICYDSDKDKFVCIYATNATSDRPRSVIFTVTGNTITTANDSEIVTEYANHLTFIYVPEKTAYFFGYTAARGEDPQVCHAGAGLPKAIIGTINSSGNTMTWGSPSVMGSDNKTKMTAVYVPSVDRVAIAYLDRYHSYKLESMVATVDWNAKTLSIGNYHVIESSGNCEFVPTIACISDSEAKVVVAYRHSPGLVNNIGTVNPSNNSIVWAGRTTVDSSGTVNVGTTWGRFNFPKVGVGKFVMTARDDSAGESWQIVRQFAATDITTENFIGFSKAAYTNGQTATVKVVGNVSTQSGLTPGKQYYVQNDGTVGSTAATPSVEAGKALTATSLLIKG